MRTTKRVKRLCTISALGLMMVLGTAQVALATSQYYNFNQNVPRFGFVYSSDKTLPNNTAFKTRLDSCTANDGSGQGQYGVYFRAINRANNTTIKNTPDVRPGSGTHTLINAISTGSRTVYIGLQAEGTSPVTAKGYWYY